MRKAYIDNLKHLELILKEFDKIESISINVTGKEYNIRTNYDNIGYYYKVIIEDNEIVEKEKIGFIN